MGFRFRKSVKLGGVRLNLGKSGISTTIGGRGASVNIGKRGVHTNVGLPGTGLSYRSSVGGKNQNQSSSANTTASVQKMAIKFMIDDETGEVRWLDEDGNPLSDELIKIAKKQNRTTIETMLDSACEKFNDRNDTFLHIHFETPPPDVEITYLLQEFGVEQPVPPDEKEYQVAPPQLPKLQDQNFLSKKIGFIGKKIEDHNRKNEEEYERKRAEWEKAQITQSILLHNARNDFQQHLFEWQEQKKKFDQEQQRRKWSVEVGRYSDIDAMHEFFEERLASLEWPLETNTSFEITNDGTKIFLDVDLPEIEAMPTKAAKVNHTKLELSISDLSKTVQQQNYLAHIHSIGFRMIGEAMAALPTVQEVVVSAYSQRTSKMTAHVEDEYLYSARVTREMWSKINFAHLTDLDIVACFELFNLRRKVSKQGVVTPIIPFTP